MESSPHCSETRNCRTSCKSSKESHQPYCCNLDWVKSGGEILWNATTICRMSKTSWQTGNLRYERRSGELFKGTIMLFDAWIRYLQKLREKQSKKFINWQENLYEEFSWLCFIRGGYEQENVASSKFYFRRLNTKKVLIIRRDEEFVFPAANGLAKLWGRNYEFQEPTPRRESTVRGENLSGQSHGDREEFQTEQTKDDEGINKNFWADEEARKEFHSSSSCWTEKFDCTCREKNLWVILIL